MYVITFAPAPNCTRRQTFRLRGHHVGTIERVVEALPPRVGGIECVTRIVTVTTSCDPTIVPISASTFVVEIVNISRSGRI